MINYEGALKAGFTPDQIKARLIEKYPDVDVNKALELGFSLPDIVSRINEKRTVKPTGKYITEGRHKRYVPDNEQESMKYAYERAHKIKEKEQEQMGIGVKKALSGATLGFSKLIPGLGVTPEEEKKVGFLEKGAEFLGSFAPLTAATKFIGAPVEAYMASRGVPETFSRLIGMGTTGVGVNATESIARGELPSVESMGKHGLIWAGIDAAIMALGKGVSFGKSLVTMARHYGKTEEEIAALISKKVAESGVNIKNAEEVVKIAENALLTIENDLRSQSAKFTEGTQPKITGKQIGETPELFEQIPQGRLRDPEPSAGPNLIEQPNYQPTPNTTPGVTEKALESMGTQEKKWFPFEAKQTPTEIKFEAPAQPESATFPQTTKQIAEQAKKEATEQYAAKAESYHPKATSEETGLKVKSLIEEKVKDAKKLEKEIYDKVEDIASGIMHDMNQTGIEARRSLAELNTITLKPPKYAAVEKSLKEILIDLQQPMSLSKAIELGRRLNDIIHYENLGPHVTKKLIGTKKAVKRDIREGLKKVSPDAEELFNQAELLHGKNAERLDNEIINVIREEKLPENVSRNANKATYLKKLKEILTPEEFKAMERALIDQIEQSSEKAAKKLFYENKKYLSKEAQKLAEEAITLKQSLESPAISQVTQTVKRELQEFAQAGKAPSQTQKLWQSEKGKEFVNSQLKQLPYKEQEAFRSALSYQNVKSKLEDITKNGSIDRQKLNKLLKDDVFLKEVQEAFGPEAVTVLRETNGVLENVERTMKKAEQMQIAKPAGTKAEFDRSITAPKSQRGEELIKRTANQHKEAEKLLIEEVAARNKAEEATAKERAKASQKDLAQKKKSQEKAEEEARDLYQQNKKSRNEARRKALLEEAKIEVREGKASPKLEETGRGKELLNRRKEEFAKRTQSEREPISDKMDLVAQLFGQKAAKSLYVAMLLGGSGIGIPIAAKAGGVMLLLKALESQLVRNAWRKASKPQAPAAAVGALIESLSN